MPKSLVEKYEQILENDPGSEVFVELAKALLERGEASRAVEVCKSGVEHHPDSIVGFVLWGKGLISCGRPAEAMEQFDKAIAVEPSNPQAYNLIGEVLLHKGLHRSAIPILKKAVGLQPNDLRVRQWLEQAQRAVSGQPAPAPQVDKTEVDVGALPGAVVPTDPGLEPTVTEMAAYVPSGDTVPGLTDVFKSLAAREEEAAAKQPATGSPTVEVAAEVAAAEAAPSAPGPAESQSEAEVARTSIDEVPSVVVSLPRDTAGAFDAAAAPPAVPEARPAQEQPESEPQSPEAESPPADAASSESANETVAQFEAGGDADVVPGLTSVFQSLAAREGSEPAAAAADPFADWDSGVHPQPPPAQKPSEVAEPPGASSPQPAAASAAPPPPPLPHPAARGKSPTEAGAPPPLPKAPSLPKRPSLLADLPPDPDGEHLEPMPGDPARGPALSIEMPSVVLASETAEEIAREYERELREKLLATPPPTFWRKHLLSLSLTGALIAALCLGLAIYAGTRRQNRGNDLIELRSQAYRALSLETPVAYRHAIELSDRVLEIAPTDVDAKAARAFANAALFRDYGEDPTRKKAAETELEAFRQAHPGLALAIPYLVANEPDALEAAKAPLLQVEPKTLPDGFERAVAVSLAGRALLAAGKQEEALERFQSALAAHSAHVGTLMALGDYYFWQTEPARALDFYRLAKTASPEHVRARMGVVHSELALERGGIPSEDMQAARAAFDAAAQQDAGWPKSLAGDLDLAQGRVLALEGKRDEAVSLLTEGAAQHASRAAEFWAALGAVEARAGNFDKAEAAYARAATKRPADPRIKEELARALIARGRPADALKATDGAPSGDRSIQIVRGLARLELGQLAKAREELVSTERNGKFPAEAAVYLARIDAAQGQRETARAMLESVAATSKEWAALAQGALGALHLSDGREAEARAAFAKAAQDPRDWEGACALGRLGLKASRFAEARGYLQTAVERNRFHAESRTALGEALLALGEASKAQAEFSASLDLSPSGAAHRGLARALLAQGNLDEARRSAAVAARLDRKSPDTGRLSAQIALASGDAQEAIRGLERAAKAEPKDPVGWCELGEVLVKVGEQRAARQAFAAALKVDKQNLRARLGMVHAALPKEARSVRSDSEALVAETATAEPAVRARSLALDSRVLLALKDKRGTAPAEERAKAAVAAHDASADAHLALALVAMANKDRALALQELQRVVGLDPTVAEAHLALADSLAGAEPPQLERALEEIDAYLRIAPKGPDAPAAKKYQAALRSKLGK